MNPNEKPGSNWPKLKPPEKLETLRRYRDQNLRSKDFERNYTADDFFMQAVVDENLQDQYMKDIALNNRM